MKHACTTHVTFENPHQTLRPRGLVEACLQALCTLSTGNRLLTMTLFAAAVATALASATSVTGEQTPSSIDTMAIMSATEAAIAKATSSSELWGQGMAENTQKAVADAVAVAVAKTAASVFQQIADSEACKAEQPKVRALGLCSSVSLRSLTKRSHISITVTLSALLRRDICSGTVCVSVCAGRFVKQLPGHLATSAC